MKEAYEKTKEINEDMEEQTIFKFDKNGYTIEPIDKDKLSEFNKKLKQALEYNPKENKNK